MTGNTRLGCRSLFGRIPAALFYFRFSHRAVTCKSKSTFVFLKHIISRVCVYVNMDEQRLVRADWLSVADSPLFLFPQKFTRRRRGLPAEVFSPAQLPVRCLWSGVCGLADCGFISLKLTGLVRRRRDLSAVDNKNRCLSLVF